jgi:subtilase family serine protease
MRFALILIVAIVGPIGALPAAAQSTAAAAPLINQKIDERQLVTLAGNTRREVRDAVSRVPVADGMRLEHIHLVLRRSASRERDVRTFVDQLTMRGSPSYHQWLTSAEFGKRFGAADEDVGRIRRWLEVKGFTVNSVHPDRMTIDFSGTAGQVKVAFHTEIARIVAGGVVHIANISDPRVPVALAPAMEGIVSLHDFHPHSTMRPRMAATGSCGQSCTSVAPGDLATIYNLQPLFAAGIRGRGSVIATVESTDLYNTSDWTTFRNLLGLSGYAGGNIKTVHPAPAGGFPCGDPGVTGDDGEATLDTEWATAAAPSATIMLASCASTQVTDGVFLAIQNLINASSPPPVISVSYAICEVDNGAAENAAFNNIYQQAAAEGISVFVATGDSGASECAPGPDPTWSGIGVNGWGTTQYNVAVGGTDFGDTFNGTNSSYWGANTGRPWSTAKSYVPEIAWNDNCASVLLAQYYTGSSVTYGASGFCNTATGGQFLTLSSGGGGPSGCYSGSPAIDGVVSGGCRGYPKPSWQRGLVGVPGDNVRDVPDVSLFASNGIWGHAYVTCFTDSNNGGGPCTGNPVFWPGNGGGTSYGAPIMAGIQTLVNQYKGGKQGNPAPVYYQLAAQQYGSAGNPNCSASLGASIEGDCIFHDVVSGDIDVYCQSNINCFFPSGDYGVLSTSSTSYAPAYRARTGYDLATGIGTVNAYNLVMNWP